MNVVYESGLKGNNVFVLHKHDVGVFVDLMLHSNETELNDSHLEIINQAMEKNDGCCGYSLDTIIGFADKNVSTGFEFYPIKKKNCYLVKMLMSQWLKLLLI